MENKLLLKNICNQLGLGRLIELPTKLYGGYMHQMFRIKTVNGDFAIKLLNPIIMKRPDALNNYNLAETLESKLQLAKIPIVSAIEYNFKKMQCSNNQYYYVFNWIDGKALKSQEILVAHCVKISGVLAEIHNIETKKIASHIEPLTIDWERYIFLAQVDFPEIAQMLRKNLNIIIENQKEGNIARQQLPEVIAICHGDMDSKNVLWEGENPKIIDLECLNYGNPYMEFFELALCWSGYEHCDLNYHLLEAFIKAYIDKIKNFKVDWEVLYHCNNGRLLWLEYNIKRAIEIECENEEEKRLGIQQVQATMEHIKYYHKIKDELINKLMHLFPQG